MIRAFREDTQWAIAANVTPSILEQLAQQLPKELQGDGSRILTGEKGFAALLVFGDVPNETLAKLLLMSAATVYLLDFDDDAPVITKLDRLNAAKSTGQAVYLSVSDAITSRIPQLRQLLAKHGIDDVEVVTFPETKLEGVSRTLRKGPGLAGGGALVTADQIAKEAADDTND